MALAGIVIAVVILFVFAYIGFPVILLTFISAMIVILTNGIDITTGITDLYLAGAASSFQLFVFIGILGSVMAEFYKDGGGAISIARSLMKASKKIFKGSTSPLIPILVVNVIGFVLCYGGINGVIAIFIMMPIAMEIMKNYDLPRYLAPGIMVGATCTAAMTMPGSPQAQNIIPSLYLGTSPTAGLVAGIIAGILVFVLNVWFMTAVAKKAVKKGDHFIDLPAQMQAPAIEDDNLPNFWISLIPMITTFILYIVVGLNILMALLAGVVLCVPCFYRQLSGWKTQCNIFTKGSMDSCGLIVVVCMLSGFGSVVAGTDAFSELVNGLTTIPGPATFKVLIAMAITVMVAGSGPAGEMAGIPMFAETFSNLGVSMNAFHRIAAFTGTCLDTLPSNSAVNIAAKLSAHSVKETYKYCFLTSVLSTSIGAIVVTILVTIFPYWP